MKKEYILDHSAIDTISNAVDGFFAENGADRRKAIEVRLSLEEYLLRLHELMPETRIFLDVRKRFGVFSIEVCYEGGEYDPISIRNEDYTFSAMLLQRMDIMPSWDYRRGINRLRFRFSAANRYNSLLATLAAMLFSALLGILGGFVGGFVFKLLGLAATGVIGSLLVSVVGACICIWIGRKLF